ncbi:MAG: hypothetical protein MMC23_006560 [Stictis urceolatum]|nr:hypothetical protein [Stictis urceolata]
MAPEPTESTDDTNRDTSQLLTLPNEVLFKNLRFSLPYTKNNGLSSEPEEAGHHKWHSKSFGRSISLLETCRRLYLLGIEVLYSENVLKFIIDGVCILFRLDYEHSPEWQTQMATYVHANAFLYRMLPLPRYVQFEVHMELGFKCLQCANKAKKKHSLRRLAMLCVNLRQSRRLQWVACDSRNTHSRRWGRRIQSFPTSIIEAVTSDDAIRREGQIWKKLSKASTKDKVCLRNNGEPVRTRNCRVEKDIKMRGEPRYVGAYLHS